MKSATSIYKRSSAQTEQPVQSKVLKLLPSGKRHDQLESDKIKQIAEYRIFKSGDSALKVIEVANSEEVVNEDRVAIVGHPTIPNRTRGQDVIDPYMVSQARRRAEARRWTMTAECLDGEASVVSGRTKEEVV